MWIKAQNYIDFNTEDEWMDREILSVYDSKEEAVKGFWKHYVEDYCSNLNNDRNLAKTYSFCERRGKHRTAYDSENDILYGGLTDNGYLPGIMFICEVKSGQDLTDNNSWGLQIWPDNYEEWKKYDKPTDMYEWRQYWLNEEDNYWED